MHANVDTGIVPILHQVTGVRVAGLDAVRDEQDVALAVAKVLLRGLQAAGDRCLAPGGDAIDAVRHGRQRVLRGPEGYGELAIRAVTGPPVSVDPQGDVPIPEQRRIEIAKDLLGDFDLA